MIGEVVMEIMEIRAIIREADSLVKDTNELLGTVTDTIKWLVEASSGVFTTALNEAGQRLEKVAKLLIGALAAFFKYLDDAVNKNEEADKEAGTAMKATVR